MVEAKKWRWDALIEKLPANVKNGVIVGVWKGDTAIKLLKHFEDLRLICVDRWCPPPEEDSYYNSDSKMALCNQKQFEAAYKSFSRNVHMYIDRCLPLKITSAEASKKVYDNSQDFIFLDGDHTYNGVFKDLTYWLPKIKTGGILCGHDWDFPDNAGVKRAVTEFLGEKAEKVFLSYDRTWFFKVD